MEHRPHLTGVDLQNPLHDSGAAESFRASGGSCMFRTPPFLGSEVDFSRGVAWVASPRAGAAVGPLRMRRLAERHWRRVRARAPVAGVTFSALFVAGSARAAWDLAGRFCPEMRSVRRERTRPLFGRAGRVAPRWVVTSRVAASRVIRVQWHAPGCRGWPAVDVDSERSPLPRPARGC